METCIDMLYGPVAQLDRALACGAKGRRFESCRVHQSKKTNFRVSLFTLAMSCGIWTNLLCRCKTIKISLRSTEHIKDILSFGIKVWIVTETFVLIVTLRRSLLKYIPMERCRSGWTGRSRKAVSRKRLRGFESLPLRQIKYAPLWVHFIWRIFGVAQWYFSLLQ